MYGTVRFPVLTLWAIQSSVWELFGIPDKSRSVRVATVGSSNQQDSPGIIVLAASLGGLRAIEVLLGALPAELPVPIVVVQHLSDRYPTQLARILRGKTRLAVDWIEPHTKLRAGAVHVAPPGSHAIIDGKRSVALFDAPRINFARPAADPLFASAAAHFGAHAIAVVLTGRLFDGASGALAIRRAGGLVIAQDPATCPAPGMPRAAIAAGAAQFVLPPTAIARAIVALTMVPGASAMFGWSRAA